MTPYEILGSVGAIVAFLSTIIFGLIKYNDSQKRREYERAFASLHEELKKLGDEHRRALDVLRAKNEEQDRENRRTIERLHAQEMANLELKGKLDLANASRDSVLKDVEEIRSAMVTKTEFAALQKTITDLLRELRPGRYQRSETPLPGRGVGG